MRLSTLTIVCFFLNSLVLLTGCDSKSHSELKKVIGNDDFIEVSADADNVPSSLKSVVGAVGEMNPGCTVTHIGNGVAITAGHCFHASAREEDVSCAGTTVTWNYRHGAKTSTSDCERILVMQQSNNLDFALIKVSNPPAAKIELDLSDRPDYGTEVTIFSHPNGSYLQWSQYCEVLQPETGDTALGASEFRHFCDTDPGSSGAAIISTDNKKIVGIHDGGTYVRNYGTFVKDMDIDSFLSTSSSGNSAGTGPSINGSSAQFGPFGSNENKILATLEKSGTNKVSFFLSADIDANYDFVWIDSAEGRVKRSGSFKEYFTLTTPVSIEFTSDSSVSSNWVKLEAIDYYSSSQSGAGNLSAQNFGPFGNSENKVLTTIGTTGYVSFRIETDTEDNFDFVIVTAADGVKSSISGKENHIISSYKAPVEITFISDSMGTSKSVKISEIKQN